MEIQNQTLFNQGIADMVFVLCVAGLVLHYRLRGDITINPYLKLSIGISLFGGMAEMLFGLLEQYPRTLVTGSVSFVQFCAMLYIACFVLYSFLRTRKGDR